MSPDLPKARAELDRSTKAEEGWRSSPYLCIAGRPTIGYGCTTYEDGRKVSLADPPITRERGQALLDHKLTEGISKVLELTRGNVGTNQLVALVVCGFNIGWGQDGLAGSSMIKAHNRGDFAAARRAFSLWNKYRPGGPGTALVVSEALEARRAREAAIYALPDHHIEQVATEEPPPIPQQVEPESKPADSQLNKTGAGLTFTGVVAAFSEWGGQLTGLKPMLDTARGLIVDTLGIPPSAVLPLILIGAGVAVIYWRRKQRQGGWA